MALAALTPCSHCNRRLGTRLMIMRIKIKCIRLVRRNTWPTHFLCCTAAVRPVVFVDAKTQTAKVFGGFNDFRLLPIIMQWFINQVYNTTHIPFNNIITIPNNNVNVIAHHILKCSAILRDLICINICVSITQLIFNSQTRTI